MGATINVVDQETFLKKTNIKTFPFDAKSPVSFVGKFKATVETRKRVAVATSYVTTTTKGKSDLLYDSPRLRANQSAFAQNIGHER